MKLDGIKLTELQLVLKCNIYRLHALFQKQTFVMKVSHTINLTKSETVLKQKKYIRELEFNNGNYLFTTDTKQIHVLKFYCPSM